MKKAIEIAVAALLAVFALACGENSARPEDARPVIVGANKNETFAKDTVTLYGKNFGTESDSLAIIFRDERDSIVLIYNREDVVKWEQTEIVFLYPALEGEKFLSVRKNGKESESILIKSTLYPLLETVEIPGGSFYMGSENGFDDEKPIRYVAITKNLIVAKYEVSQKLWRYLENDNPSPIKGDDLPVYGVSWLDAVKFCNKLSNLYGLDSVYRFAEDGTTIMDYEKNGYRLPTEAEWEYIARAGEEGDYPGGDLDAVGFYSENSAFYPRKGGEKKPNAFGLYDVCGNVWEWCWDWYAADAYSRFGLTVNPMGPSEGERRTARGGSFASGAALCRVSNRKFPREERKYVGLRPVRNADK